MAKTSHRDTSSPLQVATLDYTLILSSSKNAVTQHPKLYTLQNISGAKFGSNLFWVLSNTEINSQNSFINIQNDELNLLYRCTHFFMHIKTQTIPFLANSSLEYFWSVLNSLA